MRKILITTLLLLNGLLLIQNKLCGQSYKSQVKEAFDLYSSHLIHGDWDSALKYIYPPLLEKTPAASYKLQLQKSLNGPYVRVIDIEDLAYSDSIVIDSVIYILLHYNVHMEMKSMPQKDRAKLGSKAKHSGEDLESKSWTRVSYSYAISPDGEHWYFLVKGAENNPIYDLDIPKAVQELQIVEE